MSESFCNLYNKPLREVFDHEQEQCQKDGRSCLECDDLGSRWQQDTDNQDECE